MAKPITKSKKKEKAQEFVNAYKDKVKEAQGTSPVERPDIPRIGAGPGTSFGVGPDIPRIGAGPKYPFSGEPKYPFI